MLENIIYEKELLLIMTSSSIEKPFMTKQLIQIYIKRYKEIRKLTKWEGEDYTTAWLLDYDCIKNHYRLIAVDLKGK